VFFGNMASSSRSSSDWWDHLKRSASTAASSAEEQLRKAQQSDLWQQTSAKAKEAGRHMQEAGKSIESGFRSTVANAKVAVQGIRIEVIFTEPTLGMTLARHEPSGKPAVARVDEQGAAKQAGVEVGDVVVAIQAVQTDQSNEPMINIESYHQLMTLFPAMGRPVTITFHRRGQKEIPTGGVMSYAMEDEISKASRIIQTLTAERPLNPDAVVPKAILRQAKGLAFIRVAKIGLMLSVRGGTGIVVARLGESLSSWSAPCAVATGGLGWGFQIGAEVSDFIIVLNTHEAVEAFASGNQVSLGGNVGIAVGPVGRAGGLAANVHGGKLATGGVDMPVNAAPCFSYSHSKGLFFGISLEGAVLKPRDDINSKFYQRPISAREILSGMMEPPAAAQPLYRALEVDMSDEDAAPTGHPSAQATGPPAPQVSSEPGPFSSSNPFTEVERRQASVQPPSAAAAAAAAATAASIPPIGDAAEEGEFPPVPASTGRSNEI